MSMEVADRAVWSRSQLSALDECRRKFALNVKSSRDAAVDPVFSRAAALKKLKNRHLWAGSFVHEAIGALLKTLRQGNPLPEAPVYIEEMKAKMREQFRASRAGIEGVERLFEHEYNIAVQADVWRAHWDNVEKSLKWFFASKWLSRLASLGPECWKAVDELLEFDVNGIKAYVKIDCAVESDGKFFLIDWKTSAPTAEAEPPLLVAALYAHEVWGAEPEQIEAMAVCAADGRTFHAQVNEDALMETHLRIEEESSRLEEAKSEMGADPFAFPAPDNLQTCRRCHFQRLCHPQGV